MRLTKMVRLKLRSVFRRNAVELELDEELRYHFDREFEERLAAGLTPEEARNAAERDFFGAEQRKEECRDMRGLNVIDNLRQDLRYAVRQFRKNPGFAATAVFVLALGICANAAVFGFVDAALIKPLPYRDPGRLAAVFTSDAAYTQSEASYLDFLDWRRFNDVFRSMDAWAMNGGFTLTERSGSEMVAGTRVSAGFFRTLGVRPVLGRDFRDGEDAASAPHTALLSYASWQKRFGGRRDILGQNVILNGSPTAIIGVLPRDFQFAPAGGVEFWATLRRSGATFGESDPCEARRACHNLGVIARLKDGVSAGAASAEMKSIASSLEKEYPESNHGMSAGVMALPEFIVGDKRPLLMTLFYASALLLLIACVNVTSLLLARSDSRVREIAVRNALGASAGRLLGQFAVEAALLAGIAAAFGLVSGAWAMQFLKALIPPDMIFGMPYLEDLGMNARVAAFGLAVSFGAALLFAAAPLVRLRITRMREGLTESGRGSTGQSWRHFGAGLVAAELAIATVLLVGAGLLVKSLYLLLHENLGLRADHLAMLQMEGPPQRYLKTTQQIALERRVLDRIRHLPGVKSAGVTSAFPVGWLGGAWFGIAGHPEAGEHNTAIDRTISAGYFDALGARLLRGRDFYQGEDESKPRVVIVNESFARKFFPGEAAIGKQIYYSARKLRPMQIVGVVADIKEGPLGGAAGPAFYVPFEQSASRSSAWRFARRKIRTACCGSSQPRFARSTPASRFTTR